MFPDFNKSWIKDSSIWRADYAQPIMEPYYSKIIPAKETPLSGIYLANMAQIYPEDRGTNYAVRDGFSIAQKIIDSQ
jgi:hypothetical protein